MVIVDAVAPYVCMFKPNRAHWNAIPGGIEALRILIAYIHFKYPDIPVFEDCKVGDIDRTQVDYRRAVFELDGADGMNYNGYMGIDTLKSLIDPNYPGRALVGLGRTSNPKAWEVQDRLLVDGRRVWEAAVQDILNWSTSLDMVDNAGVVMGAAYLYGGQPYFAHLKQAREIVGDKLWFLIPGIGKQGGVIEETVRHSFMGPGSITINSSSGITEASAGEDFAEAAASEAMRLRDQMRKAGGNCTI